VIVGAPTLSAPSLSPARGLLAGLLLVATSTALAAPPPWDFKDGDRVVFVGDTFIEREQRYGYVETALTLANADKHVTFRNLGWSGDTVRGLSRAGFDPPEAGFRELVKQVTDSKPTVLVVGYGMAESFDGEAGLPRFVEGYNAFLDAVAPLKARLVLLSPLPHEKMPAPLPDPEAHNRDLKLYSEAIRSIAQARGTAFIDLFDAVARHREGRGSLGAGKGAIVPGSPTYDTDNGIHLTAGGYARLAKLPEMGLTSSASLEAAFAGTPLPAKFEQAGPAPGKIAPLGRGGLGSVGGVIRLTGLEPGRYTLKADGETIATRTAAEWAAGVTCTFHPEAGRVEALTKAVVAKNLLFFYRWRPQNITYLFGFRKHEQGQNSVEIPQFDPLVDAKEKEIAELRKPASHTYELIRETEAAR